MRKRKNLTDSKATEGEVEQAGEHESTGDLAVSSGAVEADSSSPIELLNRKPREYKRTVCIVVLGDIGRSPRMRYHAQSFSKEGFLVTIIGYSGSGLPQDILENPSISTVTMREAPSLLQKFPRLLAYPLKMAWLSVMLTFAFLWMVVANQFCPEFILLQNPPAIPSLALCWLYSKIFACDFIVDWHNYGFSLMSLVIGSKNPLVRFATWFENYFGSKADSHLCVTRAMKDDLRERLGVSAVTLYDRPPTQFKSLSASEQLQFVEELCTDYYPNLKNDLLSKPTSSRTCGILVSSTSWTEDEDFGILLSALESYEKVRNQNTNQFPKLIVFITGKGPMKDYYQEKIKQLNLKNVEIYLPWLKHEDYPRLLACADLGISLHTSSSGLDLPMKVVDMFGCGLPVCAVNFKCVSELVEHNVNGLIFNDAEELAVQIQDWFKEFPKKPNSNHSEFRANLVSFQSLRWDENWIHNVMPLLK
ncbi:Chitobiosyldiphosphodolichol beta-mannosyltransferase [Orchesella cincta]|uniref:Beta-1,4-mannosyltransferase n=1 Tax=Orchesella cincta TaxID=48709 RepID=A0A1D2MVJ8_ORCCI|nr:Chitobiosyldiphosphodolichol beta-mannosyltransferase [Orchesella cincta]